MTLLTNVYMSKSECCNHVNMACPLQDMYICGLVYLVKRGSRLEKEFTYWKTGTVIAPNEEVGIRRTIQED